MRPVKPAYQVVVEHERLVSHAGWGRWLDRGDGPREPLAVILRPGNASANDATDHFRVLTLALAQLPPRPRGLRLLVRADSARGTGEFVWHLHRHKLAFSGRGPALTPLDGTPLPPAP